MEHRMAHQHPDPHRLAREAELMYENTRASLAQSPDGRHYWIERLVSEAGRPYTLVIDYPPQFPYERPKAFIVEPPVRSGPHMLADGSLCLFDNPWATDAKCTALVVRNRAVAWMLAYEAWQATGGEWHAPQHGSAGGAL
jgi:hypothetical protein